MSRFFVDSKQIFGEQIRIIGADAKHIDVLRMGPLDEITVADGRHVYTCRISSAKKDEVIVDIVDKVNLSTEPAVKVTLFQGIPKAAKMEIIDHFGRRGILWAARKRRGKMIIMDQNSIWHSF